MKLKQRQAAQRQSSASNKVRKEVSMASGMRLQKLESFGHAPALLSTVLRDLPKQMWLYKPSSERWSVHEIILHLADSEAIAYMVCRRFIAEPGSPLLNFDGARWAETLGYFHQSTREALELVRQLRRMTYQLLLTLPEPVWERTVEHPTQGPLTLSQWIEIQERHIPHHLDQMKQNYENWLETNPTREMPTTYRRPRSSIHNPDSQITSMRKRSEEEFQKSSR
jgi:DinB superfamily